MRKSQILVAMLCVVGCGGDEESPFALGGGGKGETAAVFEKLDIKPAADKEMLCARSNDKTTKACPKADQLLFEGPISVTFEGYIDDIDCGSCRDFTDMTASGSSKALHIIASYRRWISIRTEADTALKVAYRIRGYNQELSDEEGWIEFPRIFLNDDVVLFTVIDGNMAVVSVDTRFSKSEVPLFLDGGAVMEYRVLALPRNVTLGPFKRSAVVTSIY